MKMTKKNKAHQVCASSGEIISEAPVSGSVPVFFAAALSQISLTEGNEAS